MDERGLARCIQLFSLGQPLHPPRGHSGERLGKEAGASLEFHEHRPYTPGDDLRRIDWSAYARSDQLIVRLHREEVAPSFDLYVDSSASMAVSEAKETRLRELIDLLLSIARKDRMQSTLRLSGRAPRPVNETTLDDLRFEGNAGLQEVETRPPRFRPGSLRVLLSDLLFPSSPAALVRKAAEGGSRLVVIQLLDREELDPTIDGGRRLIDVESEEELDLRVNAVQRDRYRERLARHQALWRQELHRARGDLSIVCAQDSLESIASGPLLKAGLLELRS